MYIHWVFKAEQKVIDMAASFIACDAIPSHYKYYEEITCTHTASQLYVATGG